MGEGELADSADGTFHTSYPEVLCSNDWDQFQFDDLYWCLNLGMMEDDVIHSSAVEEMPPVLSRKGKGRANVVVNNGLQELAQYPEWL
jgi:hypothetical protein